MARHQRRVQDRIRKGVYTYEDALIIDGHLRKSVIDLCGSDIIDLSDTSDWKRVIMSTSLHNRLCRLHRPFMARGFKDKRYEPSARLGLISARAVIRNLPVLIDKPPTQFWSIYRYILVACLLLPMATLHGIDAKAPPEQIDDYLGDMIKAREFLEQGQKAHNASVRAVAAQGGQIIASVRLKHVLCKGNV
jgi:hypothetical protein